MWSRKCQVSSGFYKITYSHLCKCKYLHVKITSLAAVKSCVTMHRPNSLVANVWPHAIAMGKLLTLAVPQ